MKVEKIQEIHLPNLAKLYQELVDKPVNIHNLNRVFRKIEQDANYYLLGILSETGEVLGTIMGIVCYDLVSECQPFLVMENMIVTKEHQGEGLGKLLITAIEKIAKERECIFIQFCSSMFRTTAHSFYNAVGYSDGTVKGYRKYL